MMQSRRIDPLLRRAQEHEDSVARDLAERQNTLAQHESRLEELRQYAEDYANSQMAATSPAQLANRRAFLERIDQALAQQLQNVDRSRSSVDIERDRRPTRRRGRGRLLQASPRRAVDCPTADCPGDRSAR